MDKHTAGLRRSTALRRVIDLFGDPDTPAALLNRQPQMVLAESEARLAEHLKDTMDNQRALEARLEELLDRLAIIEQAMVEEALQYALEKAEEDGDPQ
jgi:predicted nuclease with TOPRIM domain